MRIQKIGKLSHSSFPTAPRLGKKDLERSPADRPEPEFLPLKCLEASATVHPVGQEEPASSIQAVSRTSWNEGGVPRVRSPGFTDNSSEGLLLLSVSSTNL